MKLFIFFIVEPCIDFEYQEFTSNGVQISEHSGSLTNDQFGSLTYQGDLYKGHQIDLISPAPHKVIHRFP